jgi:endonuclease G, mitochondrial
MHTKPIRHRFGTPWRVGFAPLSGLILWALLTSLAGCVTIPAAPSRTGPPPVSASIPAPTVGGAATRDDNASLGFPTNAGTTNPDDYLLVKPDYTLSYNRTRGTANWVSWHLSTAWKGSSPRSKQFTPDLTLPAGWYAVKTSDYTNTGFDRGHLCPSDDRDGADNDNAGTFVLTNIVPQSPKNNRETWKNVEDYCRRLIGDNQELYIIAGPSGTGGTGDTGFQTSLANGRVTVPASLWKIIIVLPIGTQDALRITTDTRVIAVSMPNEPGVASKPWTAYITSINAIERQTGFSFLTNVPAEVQQVLKAKVDPGL